MSTKGKFALGAVVGAAAGIVAGILTAPKAGKETRADRKEKATELKSEAKARGNTAKRRAEEAGNVIRERTQRYRERGEHAVRDVKEDMRSNGKS